jgi:hypothetical protein
MTLAEVLAAAAEDLPDLASSVGPDGAVSWSVGGAAFAVLAGDGSAVALLLEPAVAAAAARTPDVVAAPERGPGWVELRPAVVDGHVADRAAAWFLSGYRRLTGARPEA